MKKTSEDLTSRDTNGDGMAANPDPAVFEAAFVIDDTDDTTTPSRVATPALADKEGKTGKAIADAAATGATDSSPNGDNGETGAEQPAKTAPTALPVSSDLPPEVRARLRKLEKLEKTYPGSRDPFPLHGSTFGRTN
jgi:hypothetical protein